MTGIHKSQEGYRYGVKMKLMADAEKFDGQTYLFHGWSYNKRTAQQEAARLRSQGYKARVSTHLAFIKGQMSRYRAGASTLPRTIKNRRYNTYVIYKRWG